MAIWGVARSKLQGFQHCGDFRGWDAQSPAAPLAPQITLVIVALPAAKPGAGRGRHPLDGPALISRLTPRKLSAQHNHGS